MKPKKPTAAQKLKAAKTEAFQRTFQAWCTTHGIPRAGFELQFHPTRKWRFDICWVYPTTNSVAVEVHGGLFRFGHHSRGKGFLDDREKMAEAQRLGWKVLEVAPSGKHPNTLYSPYMLDWLRSVL